MRVIALLPFVLFGLGLLVYPLAQVVRMAVSDVQIRSGGFIWETSGIANLQAVLGSSTTWSVFGNTVVFVVATVATTLVMGFLLAVLVDRAVVMLPVARNLLIWPAVIAPVIVSLMWLLILDPTAGGLNKLLESLGIGGQGWLASGPGAMGAVILVDTWHWTPVVFLFLYTALRAIDSSVLEAARMDGAAEVRIIRHIVLPILAPTIAAVAVVRMIMGIKAFDEMYLLTRGGPDGATTLVTQQVKILFFDNLQLGRGAAFSLVVVVAVAVGLGIVLYARSRREVGR
jgi:multiple sugar transport system permease protein